MTSRALKLFPLLSNSMLFCVSEETPLTRPSERVKALVNIIQSECWSPDISGVYDPIPTKFCEQVGLWTKGAEKYPNFGYLDNHCHDNQKTSPELIKHLKGYGFLIGGALDGKKNCCHDFMLPWQPLSFHSNQKKCTIEGQSVRKKVC